MLYYAYDELNRLKAIKRDGDTVAYFVYDALGRRVRVERGASGACSYYTYDAASRLTNLTHRKPNGAVIASFDYAYDGMGNPIRMSLANGDTCYYTYDKVYQLKSEVRLDSQDQEVYTQYFTYDKAGNRTALSVSGTLGSGTTYYDYNDADELLAERAPGGTTYYTYDGNGNTITKDDGESVSYYSYDAENRFVAYQKGEDTVYYTYDAAGRRVKREADGTVEKWVFDNLDAIAQYDGEDAVEWQHVLAGLDQVLRRYADSYAYDYLGDHLGSTRAIIDASEAIANAYDYSAFGLAHGTPTEGIANAFRFTGREWDSPLALYYFRARMMAASLGRFLSPDRVGPSERLRRYLFVLNRPLVSTDPSGRSPYPRGEKIKECREAYKESYNRVYLLARIAKDRARHLLAEVFPPRPPFTQERLDRIQELGTQNSRAASAEFGARETGLFAYWMYHQGCYCDCFRNAVFEIGKALDALKAQVNTLGWLTQGLNFAAGISDALIQNESLAGPILEAVIGAEYSYIMNTDTIINAWKTLLKQHVSRISKHTEWKSPDGVDRIDRGDFIRPNTVLPPYDIETKDPRYDPLLCLEADPWPH